MAIFKCKMCGGDLEIQEGLTICECEYCGTKQTIPALDNEKKLNLFNRANRLRLNSEFDKAASIYENIIAEFPEEAEGYWGLVLCNYGIEYVDDPATAKKIPTCHRAAFESVTKDENYELALEYADVISQKVYRDEAREIDRIMSEILSISKNEEPYDIFICYKETDDVGGRTIDSVIAQDVYDALTDKGYRVFFSRISLEDKIGKQYEPYIFAALNSAKVMLAFGTKYEYFHAVWVKNEWSRFLKLMAKDKSKSLVPCYKDLDPYDMPDEFKALQAQDMGKVGAIQDLVRGIEKLIGKEAKTTLTATSTADGSALTTRGYIYLGDDDFVKAESYFDRALDENPMDSKAYVGKVLALLRLTSLDKLENVVVDLSTFKDFDRALRFAEGDFKKQLEEIVKKNNIKLELLKFVSCLKKNIAKKQREEEIIDKIYTDATLLMSSAQKEEEYKKAANMFIQINWYKDSVALIEVCREKAEESRKRAEESRKRAEEEIAYIREQRKKFASLISMGGVSPVGLKSDGTVVAVGYSEWTDIVAVSAGDYHEVGLKSDGTVVVIKPILDCFDKGQCGVSGWTDIAAISAGSWHTVGLKSNGTVVAVGFNGRGQCDISEWTDIIAISAGHGHTVGLKSDGTVVAVGSNENGQCNVSRWTDIVAISAGEYHTIGLKSNGTVIATEFIEGIYNKHHGQCNVEDWSDIIAVSAGDYHTVGLKSDGTVVVVGDNNYQKTVSSWTDIVAISARKDKTVGLKSDGTVDTTGVKFSVSDWKLFNNASTFEDEREEFARQKAEAMAKKQAELAEIAEKQRIIYQRKRDGLCQHCGGELKGLLIKKCVNCGRNKDY